MRFVWTQQAVETLRTITANGESRVSIAARLGCKERDVRDRQACNYEGTMTATTSENAAKVIMLELKDAHLCGGLECRTISNVHAECPRCTSQTTTLAGLIENSANSMAHNIAMDAAKSSIQSACCLARLDDGSRWNNLAEVICDSDVEHVEIAARYLDTVGVLIYHPDNPALVRWE